MQLPKLSIRPEFLLWGTQAMKLKEYSIDMSQTVIFPQRTDLSEIIEKSPFEPFSLSFFDYVFQEMFAKHSYFRNIEIGNRSRKWSKRSDAHHIRFVSFLQSFTNISETLVEFNSWLENMESTDILYSMDIPKINTFLTFRGYLEVTEGVRSQDSNIHVLHGALLFCRKKDYRTADGDPIKLFTSMKSKNQALWHRPPMRSEIMDMIDHYKNSGISFISLA